MDFSKDYYAMLGVPRSATKTEIKSAFREMAKKFHPDKNPDDPTADDRFKEINLAYEVLGNDITRTVYDEFKIHEEQLKKGREKPQPSQTNSQNRRTYTKVTKVQKEHRVYIRGEMQVKYWANPLDSFTIFSSWEADYKIVPFDVHIKILDSDIHQYPGMPADFRKAYSASDLFAVPLSQPVKCSVAVGDGEEHYALDLHDIRIREPRITNVTAHENQSLATMTGEVFAYTMMATEEEVSEEVTECFGETGKMETKTENNKNYTRKEYFHTDCSTYWSPWELLPDPGNGKNGTRKPLQSWKQANGCLNYLWLMPLLIFGFAFPQLALGVFLFILGVWFLGFLLGIISHFRGLLSVLTILFFAFLLYSVIRGPSAGRGTSLVNHPRKAYDSLVSEEREIPDEQRNDSMDRMIRHHIRWKDYDSTSFDITLAVLRSEVSNAQLFHERMNFVPEYSLAPAYAQLIRSDENPMRRTHNAFDSVRRARQLDEIGFANMVVSCIQSIPYFLVVDRSCNPAEYQSAFIRQYLNQCEAECCVGYAKYGVRSPAEFIGDLKGDCDTRSLIIYAILKTFEYDVALLTSTYYQHAIVAVHFADMSSSGGMTIPIQNRNYLMWETTKAGMRAGNIPVAYQDLEYWSVDLLHEKK